MKIYNSILDNSVVTNFYKTYLFQVFVHNQQMTETYNIAVNENNTHTAIRTFTNTDTYDTNTKCFFEYKSILLMLNYIISTFVK